MTERYDVVVIGAGLGGMSAATFMAKNGLKVLMLEKHNIPGGYATSFVRGRFEFEIALHELSGVGPPERRGGLYRYLEGLGVAQRIEVIHTHELYRAIFPDLDITLPRGWEACIDKLCATFPHEAKGIRTFMERIDKLSREFAELVRQRGIGNPLLAPMRFPNLIRYLSATWGTVLNRDIQDPRVRAVLSMYWGYFGVGPGQASFAIFALAVAAYLKLGPGYIKGRSQTLSQAFISAFESHGGEVKYNSGVKKITTTNGRVTGVTTEQDVHYQADYIVSNADPIVTTRDLIGDDNVPAAFFDKLKSSTVGGSTVNVYMGIDRSPAQLGITAHENFINVDYDFDSHYEAARRIGDPPNLLLTCYNAVYPEISPPGTSMVILTTLSYAEPWYKIAPHDYVDVKTRVGEAMIRMAEPIAPDLRKYAEVVEVATPLTNIRYGGAMGGSIYGFDFMPWDHSVLRMKHRGPLAGLYFAGAWTQPGGGFEPCMFSGQMAGYQVLKKLKKSKEGGSK